MKTKNIKNIEEIVEDICNLTQERYISTRYNKTLSLVKELKTMYTTATEEERREISQYLHFNIPSSYPSEIFDFFRFFNHKEEETEGEIMYRLLSDINGELADEFSLFMEDNIEDMAEEITDYVSSYSDLGEFSKLLGKFHLRSTAAADLKDLSFLSLDSWGGVKEAYDYQIKAFNSQEAEKKTEFLQDIDEEIDKLIYILSYLEDKEEESEDFRAEGFDDLDSFSKKKIIEETLDMMMEEIDEEDYEAGEWRKEEWREFYEEIKESYKHKDVYVNLLNSSEFKKLEIAEKKEMILLLPSFFYNTIKKEEFKEFDDETKRVLAQELPISVELPQDLEEELEAIRRNK